MFGIINVITYDGTDAYCMKFIAEMEIFTTEDFATRMEATKDAKLRITDYVEGCGAEVIKFDEKYTISLGRLIQLKESGTAEEKAAVDRFEKMYFEK